MTTLGTRCAARFTGARRGAIALTSLLAASFGVQAQVAPPKGAPADELQEVVVTGSRIARPDLDNLEPTTTIDSKVFDQRGYLDVGEALGELPGFGVQPSSAAQQCCPETVNHRHRPKLRRSLWLGLTTDLGFGEWTALRLILHSESQWFRCE